MLCPACLRPKREAGAAPPAPENADSIPLAAIEPPAAPTSPPEAPPPSPHDTVADEVIAAEAAEGPATGARHVRTFHAKLSEAALRHLDEQVNAWLKGHPAATVKFANTTVGIFENAGRFRESAQLAEGAFKYAPFQTRSLIELINTRLWLGDPQGSRTLIDRGRQLFPSSAWFVAKMFEATATAVYLHGLAGEYGAEALGEQTLIATDTGGHPSAPDTASITVNPPPPPPDNPPVASLSVAQLAPGWGGRSTHCRKSPPS